VYEGVEPLTDASPDADARQQVTALFEAHALGLVKLAKVMLGDQSIAEDVVQDAFAGMYRRWAFLQDGPYPGQLSKVRPSRSESKSTAAKPDAGAYTDLQKAPNSRAAGAHACPGAHT
jgi:hypothetical protein